jgi:hypothetical protein
VVDYHASVHLPTATVVEIMARLNKLDPLTRPESIAHQILILVWRNGSNKTYTSSMVSAISAAGGPGANVQEAAIALAAGAATFASNKTRALAPHRQGG